MRKAWGWRDRPDQGLAFFMTEILREGSWAEVVSLRKRLRGRECGAARILEWEVPVGRGGQDAPGPRLPSRAGALRAGDGLG